MIYAGFWRRFAAHIIDGTIVSLALWIVLIPLGIVVGGVMAGNDLIDAAEKRKAQQQGSSLETVHTVTPLSNEITLSQIDSQYPASASASASAPVAAPPSQQPYPAAPATTPQAIPYGDPSQQPYPQPYPAAPATASEPMPYNTAPVTDGAPTNYEDANRAARMEAAMQNAPQDAARAEQDAAELAAGGLMMTLFYVLCFAAGIIYHSWFLSSKWQATPGKRVMNCMVVTREGGRLSFWHALGRHVACALSWLPFPPLCIGFYLAGWTEQKTALHDMIAGTRVVKVAATPPVIATHG